MGEEIKKKKVLVADDEPINLEVVFELLDSNLYDVLYATNGKIACQVAEAERPDLIIMDWQMPEMDGIEATGIITSKPETRETPIIIATGIMTSVEHLSTALAKGATDFLCKPYNAIEFRARVSACLRLKAQNDEIKNLLIQEKQHIEETLELKKRELSSIAVFDFEKNQLLRKVLDEIQRIEDKSGSETAQDLRELRRLIRSQLNLEGSWKNFRKHFEQVHTSFFDRLLKAHSNINPNDVKMCAYIKIGLDNAEMSQLMGIEPPSVRKSLHRLKQKLRLTSDDGLREYINAL